VKVISKNKDFMMNEEIRDKEIRVIGHDGAALGILNTKDALKLAEEKELDLVMMSPNAKPPVCRIMDIGKFIYEQQKKDKEAKKKQKVVNLKEIRLSATIEDHDIAIKAGNAKRFLLDEDKVKITVRFRGREIENSKVGHKILSSFVEKIGDVYIVEKPARQEGRNMIMILAPKRA
jgi:translation initiation factor IF-3